MHHEDAVSAEPALELRDGGAAAMQQQEFGAIAVEPGARKFFLRISLVWRRSRSNSVSMSNI